MKQMTEDVRRLLNANGQTEEDKGSLGKLFWSQEKAARQNRERAELEGKECGWLKGGKYRTAQAKAEKHRMKWSRYAMWWQGAEHVMKDDKGPEQENRRRPPLH